MILLIHGAGATSIGFNYLSLWLDQELQTIDYKVGDSHEDIFKKIQRPDEVEFIIGHSYGGLLAAEWISQDVRNVKGIMSVATPWQGSPTARILNWFLSDAVWEDMKPGSALLTKINKIYLNIPVANMVANPHQGGNGLAGTGRSENDGTIPVDSARNHPVGFRLCRTTELTYGHGEILQTQELVEAIRLFTEDPVEFVRPKAEMLDQISTLPRV